MTIEITIKILTIIGSSLGAVAFFQNISKEITNNNKEKWKKLNDIVSTLDFENLEYQITGRKIRNNTFDRITDLYYIIDRENIDIIGFKSVFKNKIHSKLLNIHKLYDELRKYIQVPYWYPIENGWKFDKDFYFEKEDSTWTSVDYDNATRKYSNHIQEAELLVMEMRQNFKQIQILANKDSYELILPWKWF